MEEDLHAICTRSASLLHTRELRCCEKDQGSQGHRWHGPAAASRCVPSDEQIRTDTLSRVRGVTSAGGRDGFPDRSKAMASRGDLKGEQMTTQMKSLYDRLGGLDA